MLFYDKEERFAQPLDSDWPYRGVAAVVASVTTAMIFIKKKEKEDKELEDYLNYSIQ